MNISSTVRTLNNQVGRNVVFITVLTVGLLMSGYSSANDTNKLTSTNNKSTSTNSVTLTPGAWQSAGNEHKSNFKCDSNKIMVGRKHADDEEGETHYKCATGQQFDQLLTLSDEITSDPIKESAGVHYTCPLGKVMTGRAHSGDENDDTTYYCKDVKDKWGNKMDVILQGWSNEMDENDSEFTCPPNQAMAGRYHDEDENGPTKYRCAIVR
jgi:hypothetical protein